MCDKQRLYSCMFCHKWLSVDSIEHFSQCRVSSALAEHFLKLPRRINLKKFICLDEERSDLICKRALHLYLLKKVYDQARFGNDAWQLNYRAQLLCFVTNFPCFIRDYRLSINPEFHEALL